jgi:hypothetical protein
MASRWKFLALSCVAIAAVGACSSKQDKPPPENPIGSGTPQPGSGGVGGDGGLDATGDVACAPITNSGSQVTETYVGEPLPLPLGGAITPGTYVLSAAFVYTGTGGNAGPTGRILQETRTFDGTAFADIAAAGDADGGVFATEFFANGTYLASGSQLRFDETCPNAGSTQLSFSVTGGTLRIYEGQTERDFVAQ